MEIKNLNKDILINLCIWLRVSAERLKKLEGVMPDKDNSFFEGVLDSISIGFTEALIRRATHKIVKYIKENNRYGILNFIKRVRQMYRKDLVEIAHCRFVALDRVLRERLSLSQISWNNKRGVVCLSHDIDIKEDYLYMEEVFKLNKKYKLVSGFNLLTNWGYKIDNSFLREIRDNGFEIGLHGYTHDIAIGIRSEKRIRKELSLALKEFDFPVSGYRAPAFAISRRLLKILKELGIKYDSSMKTTSCYSSQSAEVFYPYKYPNIGIWEVPLTIQDDRVFRDLHLSNEEALGVIKELVTRIMDIGGVCVINNHPSLIHKKRYYYVELLKWLASLHDIWVARIDDVVKFMEERENTINADKE